ncbi:MAG: TorF family putative porin [Methylophilales bacterium]|nr:TorF family putative porin [Methylophilales bacterium]
MTTSYSTFAEDAPAAEAAAPAAAAEPAPPYTLTFNLGLYSHYVSRGVINSRGPVMQGGIDFAHSSGFYVGTWFSQTNPYNLGKSGSVTSVDAAGNPLGEGNNIETDWYGGYSHTFDNGLTLGIGGNYVWYPEDEKSYHNRDQDTFEGNVSASYKWFTYTYYHAFTDWYGIGQTRPAGAATAISQNADTSGNEYHEIKFNYTLPFADLNLTSKVGYQRSDDICLNQKDFLVGINRNFAMPTGPNSQMDGFNAGFNVTGTFGEESCSKTGLYYTDDNGYDTNRTMATFFIKRSW